MLKHRFAVIKLWPELKTAEDECISRLKLSARAIGLECIEVDSFARLVEWPHTQLTQDDVDFVLSLHYETPKRYDIFSFVALWNPLEFFHMWGYRLHTLHLLTHDDFLSCSSESADDHVRRIIAEDPLRDGPVLKLFHSLSEPILPPTIGSGKLIYIGLNWERVQNKPSRHDSLLRLLDKTGDMKLFGPQVFQGVKVWAGFQSYVGPLPFDGVSVVREIHKAGVSLVLSSNAHKEAGLMSSRLFESLAAGAVIICDENPWARRHFGDLLLYIDTSGSPEETCAEIQNHLQWVKDEPAKAMALVAQAQEKFLREFRMDLGLSRIYEELSGRMAELASLCGPKVREKISLILLMPEFRADVLENHVTICEAQRDVDVEGILVVHRRHAEMFGDRMRARLKQARVPIRLEVADYFVGSAAGVGSRPARGLGKVISEVLREIPHEDLVCLVGPNERLFSDHLSTLLGALQRSENAGGAASDAILEHRANGQVHGDLNTALDFGAFVSNRPLNLGRFLLRTSKHPPGLRTVLPYLNSLAAHALAGTLNLARTRRATVVVDIQNVFCTGLVTGDEGLQLEILIDFMPTVFSAKDNDSLNPVRIDLGRVSSEDKTKLAVELAHSIPVPKFVRQVTYAVYRAWLRRFHR